MLARGIGGPRLWCAACIGLRGVPRQVLSTYRIQLRAEFDFDAAAALADYLAALGVSHLYCSPYLQAAAGSTHGYDVVDPTRVNELTEETFAAGPCRAADLLGRFPVALLSWLAIGEERPDLGAGG